MYSIYSILTLNEYKNYLHALLDLRLSWIAKSVYENEGKIQGHYWNQYLPFPRDIKAYATDAHRSVLILQLRVFNWSLLVRPSTIITTTITKFTQVPILNKKKILTFEHRFYLV